MSELPTGVSRSDLERVVRLANVENSTLAKAILVVGIDLESILRSKACYWFLFDNLNRFDAQLLWVWKSNYGKTGVIPYLVGSRS